jgi:hypothetical protein
MAVNAAERKQRTAQAQALASEAPQPLPAAATPAVTQPAADAAASDDLPLEERCKADWQKSATLQAEFGGNFGAYLAFQRATATGRARVFSRAKA